MYVLYHPLLPLFVAYEALVTGNVVVFELLRIFLCISVGDADTMISDVNHIGEKHTLALSLFFVEDVPLVTT